MEYTLAKFLHVIFAIIAVGFNASYGIWLARAAREPGAMSRGRTLGILVSVVVLAIVLLMVTKPTF